jgi:hypothetical protein
MSWLENRIIQYLYRDPTGEEIVLEFSAKQDPPDLYELEGRVYKRSHALPYKTNLTFKIQFERNGLVAYKYCTGDGKPRIVSATRENYEHNMGNTGGDKLRELKAKGELHRAAPSITTKGYKDAFKKVQAKKGVK